MMKRVLMAFTFGVALAASPAPITLRERLVYCTFNLQAPQDLAALALVMRRAAAAGYTGIVLADFKFGNLTRQGRHYLANVERVKTLAADLHLEIIPAVFPIGDSRGFLALDPNLAEGLPVRDALFVVRAGLAALEPDPPVALPDFHDLSAWSGRDESVRPADGAALMRDPQGSALFWLLVVAAAGPSLRETESRSQPPSSSGSVARLGVADLIGDGAISADELARATGSHAPSLGRFLRGLVAIGILAEDARRHL